MANEFHLRCDRQQPQTEGRDNGQTVVAMRRPGKFRQRRDRSAFADVMLALSVVPAAGLLFWIWLAYSIVPVLPHYPDNSPAPSWEYWAGGGEAADQPVLLFTAVLLLLFVYIFVLLITGWNRPSRRQAPERAALSAGFLFTTLLVSDAAYMTTVFMSRGIHDQWITMAVLAPVNLFNRYFYSPDYTRHEPDPGLMARLGGEEFRIRRDDYRKPCEVRIGSDKVLIVDPDTLIIDGRDHRIWGIDALQTEQRCSTEDERRIRCGFNARDALVELMTSVPPDQIRCYFPDAAHYGRTISCRAGDRDIGEWMVRNGHAFPTWAGRHRYKSALEEAITEKEGAWGTEFLPPRDWIKARCNTGQGICMNGDGAD